MLDSNVHDLVVANRATKDAIVTAIRGGRLTLVSTHVQRDELSCAPATKRDALLDIYKLAEIVPTSGAVWDVSRWDESTYVADEVNASIDALMAGNSKHAEDALIASTAAAAADVLVTNEIRLASKINGAGFPVSVWSWDQFVAWL